MSGINESNFTTTLLPKEKIAFLKLLEHFDVKLLSILREELKQGNKIGSVYDNLSNESMMVVLSRPFKRKYETDGLQFSSSNDPHNGGDCYSTLQPMPYTLTAPVKG